MDEEQIYYPDPEVDEQIRRNQAEFEAIQNQQAAIEQEARMQEEAIQQQQAAEAAEQPSIAAQVEQKEKESVGFLDAFSHMVDPLGALSEEDRKAAAELKAAPVLGVGDTAVGFVNWATQGNLGTDDLQEQWNKTSPSSDNPFIELTRKISGLLIPSFVVPGAVIPRLAAIPGAAKLPGAMQFLGSAAARLGIDTTILASSSSATDENLAQTFGDYFGWYAPWATQDGDSPDVRRKLNMLENVYMLAPFEIVGGIFRYRSEVKNMLTKGAGNILTTDDVAQTGILPAKTAVRYDSSSVVIAKTDEGVEVLSKNIYDLEQQQLHPDIQAIDEEILALGPTYEWGEAAELRAAELLDMRKRIQVDIDDMDPLTRSAFKTRNARNRTLKDEAIEIIADDPMGEKGFNPIVNDPALASQRAVTNAEGDVLGAVLDHDKIMNSINTVRGRARAALPTKGMRALVRATKAGERSDLLEEVGAKIPKQIDAIYENKWKRSAEDLKNTVDTLVYNMYNMNTSDMAKALNKVRTNIQEGYQAGFLDDESFVSYSQAFRRVFDEMFDPKRVEASAIVTKQAADSVSDAAHAAVVMDDTVDTTRLMDNALANMELVNAELRANRFLWGYQGRVLNMAKQKNPRALHEMQQMVDQFDQVLQAEKQKGSVVVNSLREINKNNPQYLNAFKKAYDLTDGNVDELYKLHRWSEDKIGLIKKGFIDGNPEVPSLVVQGIHGIRYNSFLNGRAPVRALLGNTILTMAKPISAFAGAGVRGRYGDFKRAWATYSGITENFQRALKHLASEWDYVRTNPELAMTRGRADIKWAQSDQFEAMEAMADGWRAEGKVGKVAMFNFAKLTSRYNSNQFVRWGVNALQAIDGFTNSMMAAGTARAKAYDKLMASANGAFSQEAFLETADTLYRNSFDDTGLLTDEAAKFAASEIALNLDNKVVSELEKIIARAPALKPLFLFPRTGVNALEVAWSFNPLSALGMAQGRARQLFRARTAAEKAAVLREHGIHEFTDIAFESLKNEYVGRQVMGSAVVMAAGMFASQGGLTGNGPVGAQERRDMQSLGWKPMSIRNPFTGQWHSYKGLEPFDKILATVADIWYESTRVDSTIAEEWYQKLAWSLGANVSNSTFLSGLQPLVSLLGRDETAWNRFIAHGHIDPTIPFAFSGVRSMLNEAIGPQLKDVQNDIVSYIQNRSKFLFNQGGPDAELVDQIDVYTGERINYVDPPTSWINAMMPVFKQNGGMEPWRQWLIGTGWDGLHKMRMNRDVPGKPLEPDERWFINTWVAKNAGLKIQIEELMKIDQDPTDARSLAYYKKHLRGKGQDKFPVGKTFIHDRLTKIHNEAFKHAWAALRLERQTTRPHGMLEGHKRDLMKQGMYREASKTQEQIEELRRLQTPITEVN